MERFIKILFVGAVTLWLGACATIVEGSDQSITVTTDPTGAICELERDGSIIAVVNPTPGTIQVGKSKHDIGLRCEKPGYQPGTAAASSSFQGMTFGNILFGGLIGVAVDAGSGAMHKYPAHMVVRLSPDTFPSAPARDRHFDNEIDMVRREGAEAEARLRESCEADKTEECNAAVARLRTEVRNKISDLEIQRARSTISS